MNAVLKPVAGHLKEIAQRQTGAFDQFAACLVENFGQTPAAAEKYAAELGTTGDWTSKTDDVECRPTYAVAEIED